MLDCGKREKNRRKVGTCSGSGPKRGGCCEIWVKEVSGCVSSCEGNKNVVNQVNVDDVEGVNSSKILEVGESELERNEATFGKEHLVLSAPILSVQRSLEGSIDVVDDAEQIPDPVVNYLCVDINLVDHVERFDPITLVEAENWMKNTPIICPNTDPLPYALLNMERPDPVPIFSEVVPMKKPRGKPRKLNQQVANLAMIYPPSNGDLEAQCT
ncbi:unnamed protein product [Amaranthus hypochondriacus]